MSTTVTYKGNTIATVDNNTKTLETEGKYLEADVILTDVSGGGGGGSTVDIRIVDQLGMINDVIYPPSATWTGFDLVGSYVEGTLTIPTNSMFILTTMGTVAFTCEQVTATKITQTGKSINPFVYYVYVGTTNGWITTGGPLD